MADLSLLQDSQEDTDGLLDFVSQDEMLTPMGRLDKYISSENVFNRQMVARSLLDTLRAVSEDERECVCVLERIDRLADDSEPTVRAELMEQIPHIAIFCQENRPSIPFAFSKYLLPIVVRYLADQNNLVRKTSQAALLVLLEQELIERGDVESLVCPVLVDLTAPDSNDDVKTEAMAIICKMAPMVGKDVTERLFLPRFCEMCCDCRMFHVRKVCAANFGDICSVVGGDATEELLLPRFFQLCSDNVWGVRKACAECFMTVSSATSAEVRRTKLSSLFISLISDPSRWVRQAAFQSLGQFISTFASPGSNAGQYFRDEGNWSGAQTHSTNTDASSSASETPAVTHNPSGCAEEGGAKVTEEGGAEVTEEGQADVAVEGRAKETEGGADVAEEGGAKVEEGGADVTEEGGAKEEEGGAEVVEGGADVAEEGGAKDVEGGAKVEEGGADVTEGGAKKEEGGANVVEGGADVAEEGGGEQEAESCSDSKCLHEETEASSGADEEPDSPTNDPSPSQNEQELFNSFQYWRTPIPELDLKLLEEQDKRPSAPALGRKQLEELIENLEPHIDDPDVKAQVDVLTAALRATALDPGLEDAFLEPRAAQSNPFSSSGLLSENTQRRGSAREDDDSDLSDGGVNPEDERKSKQQDVVPQALLDQYLSMTDPSRAQTVDMEIAKHCAFSLPGVALTLGRQNWHCLRDTYETLASDMQWKVRRTLAFSIHELALILGDQLTAAHLVPIFNSFLKDLDEVRIGVLKHLYDFLKLLHQDTRRKYLYQLQEFLVTDNSRNWRFRCELAEQLVLLLELYSAQDVHDYLRPLAFCLCTDRVSSVRWTSYRLVSEIIRKLSSCSSLLVSFLAELVEKFCHCQKWSGRQAFAFVCQLSVEEECLTLDQFSEHLLHPLLQLASDPVPNVRVLLAKTLRQTLLEREYFLSSAGCQQEALEHTLVSLQTDVDKDVKYFASFHPGSSRMNEDAMSTTSSTY
ncbi:serine/threonine-protein phosphatase 4 regulatory subunit 1 isoform X2 [Pseudorasbora parva]|uniref:serine/threonine-protein phosphatase 4 regulatory subunit 1 isoform X2 n=1 Tax=Pseudorasbora parva TaxID=51549 RepID=UPI00351F1951